MDQRLPLSAYSALKLHQWVCANCARYARQLHEMRRLLRLTPHSEPHAATLSRDAALRIETELQKRLEH